MRYLLPVVRLSRDARPHAKLFLDYYAKSQNDYPGVLLVNNTQPTRFFLYNLIWLDFQMLLPVIRCGIWNTNCCELGADILLTLPPLHLFWNAIVCEVEGIENRMFGGSCKRPFSVVNVHKRNDLVFVWKDVDIIGKEMRQIYENPDLEELLASMNEPDNDPDTV